MDDINLETRLAAAVNELQPSADLDKHIAGRIAQRQRQRRVARAGVSVIAGLVVVAMVGTLIAVNQGRGKKVIADRPGLAYRWSTLPAPPLPGRENAASVWSGTEAIFWGGLTPTTKSESTCTTEGATTKCSIGQSVTVGPDGSTSLPVRADGAAYNPANATWRVLPVAPIGPRSDAASVWTGTEMIVWGGWRPKMSGSGPNSWADGAAYNPTTNTWRAVPPAPIGGRIDARAVWTGREMIVLGGTPTDRTNDGTRGAAYDPATNAWRTLPDLPAPSRFNGVATSAVWTGDQVLFWVPSAEIDPRTKLHQPALFSYRPDANRWSRQPSPAPQFKLVWDRAFVSFDNGRLIVVGAVVEGHTSDVEAVAYDPAAGTWSKIVRRQNTEGRLVGVGGPGIVGAGGPLLLVNVVSASVLEPSTGSWHAIPSQPFGITGAALVVTDDGTVYVWGAEGEARLAADR